MYQLNVKLNIGDKTPDGHTYLGWAKYHIELFDDIKLMNGRIEYWRSVGVTATRGKLTEKSI